jgi:hypothetical protein
LSVSILPFVVNFILEGWNLCMCEFVLVIHFISLNQLHCGDQFHLQT